MSRDWTFYLDDILESCDKILRYTAGVSFDLFIKDEKTYDAVVRNLEIIGEASKNIPDLVRVKMPGIEWKKTAGLRDVIAHAYFGIDDSILWDVVRNKIPELKQTVEMFYKNIPKGQS